MDCLKKEPMQLTNDLGIEPGSSYLLPTDNDDYYTLRYMNPNP